MSQAPAVDFNLADVHEALAAALPDHVAVVFRDQRVTWTELNGRARRLANALLDRDVRARRPTRAGLGGHESHQDHLAIYCRNGTEYLESMLGAFKARVAPLNVNYRYVAEELRQVLDDSRASAIVFDAGFAETLATVLPDLPEVRVLFQIDDGSGSDLLPGAVWYHDALAAASGSLPDCAADWSPEDLYILYTGGTTGLPKGVLWRQADIFRTVLGGRRQGDGEPYPTLESIVGTARSGGVRAVPTAPFMHGASQWIALLALHTGGTVLIPDVVTALDPPAVLTMCERERATLVQIVGDAFARPLLEEIERGTYDLSSLFVIVSGGAPLSSGSKAELLGAIPNALIVDGLGSSEGGSQAQQISMRGVAPGSGSFGTLAPGTGILSHDLSRQLEPGDDAEGWLAKTGDVPLGYLEDPAKTASTFPTVNGVRYSVPGDRARWNADGTVRVLGRASVTINTGGEKVFAEEVEDALRRHPDVYDVVVAGRPSERWGHEVVAVVQTRAGVTKDEEVLRRSLSDTAAEHIARFKLPKDYVFVASVQRSPAGKADYRWATAQVEASSGAGAS